MDDQVFNFKTMILMIINEKLIYILSLILSGTNFHLKNITMLYFGVAILI